MTSFVAPDRISVDWDGEELTYSEAVDTTDMSDEMIEKMMRDTEEALAVFGVPRESIDVTEWEDEVRIGYTVSSGDPTHAVSIGAVELLVVLDGLGGDVDRPYHMVKAMGPGAER